MSEGCRWLVVHPEVQTVRWEEILRAPLIDYHHIGCDKWVVVGVRGVWKFQCWSFLLLIFPSLLVISTNHSNNWNNRMKVWTCSARAPTAWVLFRWGYRKNSAIRISKWWITGRVCGWQWSTSQRNFLIFEFARPCFSFRLTHIATVIYYFYSSLSRIKRMLDEMENDLDKTTQRLDFVTQKTKEMIKRSGGKQNFLIIVALIVVAFILILLILYTWWTLGRNSMRRQL